MSILNHRSESVDVHVYVSEVHITDINISQDTYGDVQPALEKSTDLLDVKGIVWSIANL